LSWRQCKIKSFVSNDKNKTVFVHVDVFRSDLLGLMMSLHDYYLRDKQNRLFRLWSDVAKEGKYDVVLFETGLHWNAERRIFNDLSVYHELKIFSQRISKIFSDVFAESTLIYMPIWQPNFNCPYAVEPLKSMMQYWGNSSLWDHYNWMYLPDINRIIINAFEKKELFIMDTSALSLNPLGRVGNLFPGSKRDCVHAPLPGVYDVLGDWLWTLLVSISM